MSASVELASLDQNPVCAWRETLLSLASPSAFLGPTFSFAAFRAGIRSKVLILQDGEGRTAFFPFALRNCFALPAVNAERVGGEMSDACGIVAAPGFTTDWAQLLCRAGISSFNFSHLPEEQLAHGLNGEAPRRGLMIDIGMGVGQFWEDRRRLDVKFVRDTERRERKLEQDFGAIRFQFDATERMPELSRLITMKRAQYRRTGKPDGLAAVWKQRLLHELVNAREPDCTSLLSVLHAGDTWVASHFGLQCGPVLHYWFPVYNPDVAKYAPGRILLRRVLNECAEHGITLVDRGEGDSPAKRDFANRERQYFRGLVTRGPLGLALRAGYALAWRLAPAGQTRMPDADRDA